MTLHETITSRCESQTSRVCFLSVRLFVHPGLEIIPTVGALLNQRTLQSNHATCPLPQGGDAVIEPTKP